MNNSEKKQRLMKNTFIVGIGSIASKGIIFLMAPLFSKWLSVEEYGAFDLITTYVSLLLPFCTLSVSEAVFRFLLDDLTEENRFSIVSSGFFLSLSGYCVFFLLFFSINFLWLKNTHFWQVCFLLASQLIFSFFIEVARGIKRVELYSLFSLVSVILLSAFSTIFLLVFKMGIAGIVLGYSLAYFISGIGLIYTTNSYKIVSVKNIDYDTLKSMLRYSWPLIPNSISWWVVNVSDRLIINRFIGLGANGIYAVANKMPAIVNVFFSVFHISWVQSASETINENDYEQYCNSVLNSLIPFLFSAAAILIGGNFIFFNFFFDKKYSEAYYYSPLLILAAAIACIGQFMGGIMIAKKQTKQNGLSNIIAAISNIVINLSFVSMFGLVAASVSTLAAYLIMVLFRYSMIKKFVRLKLNKKSLSIMAFTSLILAGVYANQLLVNVFLFVISCFVFCLINRNLISKVINAVFKKNTLMK